MFGLWPIAGKLIFDYLDPMALAGIRSLGGAIVLVALQPLFVTRTLNLREDGWRMAGLALLGVVLNQGLYIVGLSKTSAVNAALVVTTIPVFTYAIAVMTGREGLGPKRALGIALSFGGVAYLIARSGLEFGADYMLGDILVAMNALAFALYLVYSKTLTTRLNPLNLMAWQFVVAAAIFVPFGLYVGMEAQLVAMPAKGWWVLTFIILGPTAASYVLNATALRDVPASTVGVFVFLQPVFAAIGAGIFLGEQLSWRILPAVAAVLGGVYLVAKNRRNDGKKKAEIA